MVHHSPRTPAPPQKKKNLHGSRAFNPSVVLVGQGNRGTGEGRRGEEWKQARAGQITIWVLNPLSGLRPLLSVRSYTQVHVSPELLTWCSLLTFPFRWMVPCCMLGSVQFNPNTAPRFPCTLTGLWPSDSPGFCCTSLLSKTQILLSRQTQLQ